MNDIQLTSEQAELIDKLKTWFRNYEKGVRVGNHPQYFSYSGGAGVGKTFTIKKFIEEMDLGYDEYISTAYVGKAVLNLQRNNLHASTIHSLIYRTIIDKVKIDEDDDDGKYKMVFKFFLREELDEELRLIIVDEATMVNNKMRDELLSFGLPIIFIGDMNQLPPVFGISEVMMNPDFILTKIMRQAENDPIVILAQKILHDEPLDFGEYGESIVVDSWDIDKHLLDDFDSIICGKNITRDRFNGIILNDILGRTDRVPFIGAKVVNRQNNWSCCVDGFALTNGLIGTVTNISKRTSYKGYYKVDFKPDFMEHEFEDLMIDKKYILLDHEGRKNFGISKFEKFEYAYVLTTWLMQGSEADRVLYLDEYFWDADMTKKLRYTAITRAKKKIVIVMPPRYKRKYF